MPIAMLTSAKYIKYAPLSKIDFIVCSEELSVDKPTFSLSDDFKIKNFQNIDIKFRKNHFSIDDKKLFLFYKELEFFKLKKILEKPYYFNKNLFDNLKEGVLNLEAKNIEEFSDSFDEYIKNQFINYLYSKLNEASIELILNLIDSLFFAYITYNLSKYKNIESKIINPINQDLNSLAIISKYLFAYDLFERYELNSKDLQNRTLCLRLIFRLFNEKVIHKKIYHRFINKIFKNFLSQKKALRKSSLKEIID